MKRRPVHKFMTPAVIVMMLNMVYINVCLVYDSYAYVVYTCKRGIHDSLCFLAITVLYVVSHYLYFNIKFICLRLS